MNNQLKFIRRFFENFRRFCCLFLDKLEDKGSAFSKCGYIICICIICLTFFSTVKTLHSAYFAPVRHHYSSPYQQKINVSMAYSLYYLSIFPAYFAPVLDYLAKNKDYVYPLSNGIYSSDNAKKIMEKSKNKTILNIFPSYSDMGMVFIICFVSYLVGQFFPIGCVIFNIFLFLLILIFLFHSFYKTKLTLFGFIFCTLLASSFSNRFIMTLYFYPFTGWGYPLLAALLILAIFLPVILNHPLSINSLWCRIIFSALVFFLFLTIRSSVIFMGFSILFFVLIYGAKSIKKKIIRTGITFILLFLPYYAYSKTITYLRNYNHSKFKLPASTDNYNDSYHLIWHGIYCGLGDYGKDKGFKWLDGDALQYAKSLDPKVNGYMAKYEMILKKKVIYTIFKSPLWYAKILLLRIKRIFWDDCNFFAWKGFSKIYLQRPFFVKFSLILFLLISITLKSYRNREFKIWVFLIPSIFTGLFITTAGGPRYYFGLMPLMFIPLAFVISFFTQHIIYKVIRGEKYE